MEVTSKEVLINTETVISCKATGIYEQLSIKWTGFTAGENFVESSGSYDSSTNSQTGTLTVKSAAVNTDKTYSCSISSSFSEEVIISELAHINVYGEHCRMMFLSKNTLSMYPIRPLSFYEYNHLN